MKEYVRHFGNWKARACLSIMFDELVVKSLPCSLTFGILLH